MPGVVDEVAEPPAPAAPEYGVLKQRVDLDIDFLTRSVRGSTEITLQPFIKDLKQIRLHCRQCKPKLIQAGGIAAKWEYEDPYRRIRLSSKTTVHQHEMLKKKVTRSLQPSPEPELSIVLPSKLKIQELHVDPATALPIYPATPSLQKQESDAMAIAETPITQNFTQQGPQFAPIKLTIEFEVEDFRDGLHWIGCDGVDQRYPHLYTKSELWPGNTSCIFPCLDDTTSRCSWEIAIRCPRTLGDAFRRPRSDDPASDGQVRADRDGDSEMTNGVEVSSHEKDTKGTRKDEFCIALNEGDAVMELAIVCIGEMVDDVADPEDETRHTVTFSLSETVAARHIGFAVGPFEHVDLTVFRATEEEEKLGQTAVKVDGYCLPGRADEVENTCVPICQAVDLMGVNYGRFPFTSYQMIFVDDLIHDTVAAAGLSICSTRLLFPHEIIEPLDTNTRVLVRAVTDQWSGVNISPKEPTDAWVIAGIAGYMTDVFMKKLAGNNEYRWQQKLAAEKIYELDVDRPSIHQSGHLLHLDKSIRDFVNLKSRLILGILDRRLVKSSGSTGVMRIISKIFLNAKTGSLTNGELSTQDFQRTCEKLGHNKLEAFFRQWVTGAGCPIFHVTQRFNKKKLTVEMHISQRQLERVTKPPFEPSNFMREAKEHVQEVWAPETQTVFTGPMTIRIHEADGTPYEHIVEIREAVTKLDIPYNTKYKRLKRSRRQKERAIAEGNSAGEGGDDALLYCLGDILDTPEDAKEWNLADWTAEDEEKMGQESYEWIRMDADFEWIGKIHLVMPLYMYISQLQQDRDLVAQYESMRYLLLSNPHHVSLTILVRTLMDSRYFHGIRVMAAEGLATLGRDTLAEIGQHHLEKAFSEMFCDEGTVMPRPNDFSSRETFIIQCAIPRAMARLRDVDNKVPAAIRRFFVDKLKFNDNSDNSFSDCHYVATLMTCLADSLVASHREIQPTYHFAFDGEEPLEPENPDAEFEGMAVSELERYRRIDEWIMTYQNTYSITAIECLEKLSKAGIVKDKAKELAQYTRPTTADNVRLAAFKCLNEIGLSRRMPMMRYLIHSLAEDASPYFRDRLLACLGEALGHIALGVGEVEKPQEQPAPADGLVLEQEASNEARRIEAARKTTPEGALAALKANFLDEVVFQQALWYAATSPDMTINEIAALCDIAALLYDPVTSHKVTLKYPRPYKCENKGHGKVRFFQHGSKYRTSPVKGLAWDDYQTLESLALRYNGKLANDTEQKIAKRDQETTLKLRIAQTQQQIQSAQHQNQTIEVAPPGLLTPSAEKSGFKLSLTSGPKRKATADVRQREDSPKVPKISKASTPHGHGQSTSKAHAQHAKPTTPSSKKRIVTLRYSKAKSTQVKEILSKPSKNANIHVQPRSQQIPRSITPGQQKSPSPAQQQSNLASPQQNGLSNAPSSFSAQPTSINVGGFRSYGPTTDAKSAVSTPSAEVKRESVDSNSPLASLTKLPPAPSSLTSASPTLKGESKMAPPPKPKLKLKLGGRPSNKSELKIEEEEEEEEEEARDEAPEHQHEEQQRAGDEGHPKDVLSPPPQSERAPRFTLKFSRQHPYPDGT